MVRKGMSSPGSLILEGELVSTPFPLRGSGQLPMEWGSNPGSKHTSEDAHHTPTGERKKF
jgi:hypothetical protein